MKFLVEERGKFEESLYQFFYQFLSVLWMQTFHTNVIKGPFLRYHASVSWLPMSTVHATEAWTLKNGVLMTFVFCMEDLQVEFFHCGLWVLLFFITHWMVGNRIPLRDIYVGKYLFDQIFTYKIVPSNNMTFQNMLFLWEDTTKTMIKSWINHLKNLDIIYHGCNILNYKN